MIHENWLQGARAQRSDVVVASASVLASLVTIVVAKSRYYHEYPWYVFALWLIAATCPTLYVLIRALEPRSLWREISPTQRVATVILLFAAVFTRLYALDDYPFMAINDEIREGGNVPQQLVRGARDDFFGFYGSIGLTAAGICGFFYRIFGESLLTYRVPAAIFSLATIFLTWVCCSRYLGATIGILAATTLMFLPVEVHYARTLAVVELAELCAVVIFAYLVTLYEQRKPLLFLNLGIALGFSLGSQMSVYPIAYASALISIYLALSLGFRGRVKAARATALSALGALLIGCLTGLGPRVFSFSLDRLYGERRLIAAQDNSLSLLDYGRRYLSALEVYYKTDMTFFYSYEFLTPILGVIMAVGMLASLARPNPCKILSLFFVLLIPLTNSALTSGIHFSHRLLVAAPFASVLISIGVSLLADTARRIILGRVAPIVLAGFVTHLGLNVRHHFISERDTEPLSAPHVHGYYALRYLVEYLEPYRATLPRSLCLRVCPSCEIFNTDHSVGFVSFFYPDTAFQVQFDPAFSSYREIGVTSDCGSPMSENPLVANFCERPTLYRCPKELPPLQVRVERRVLREE